MKLDCCTAVDSLGLFMLFLLQSAKRDLILVSAHSIICYECDNQVGPCNEGQCHGKACVKVETAMQGKVSVHKGCTLMIEEPSCVTTDIIVGVQAQRCVCTYDFCNGDTQLVKSGLEEGESNSASGDRTKRTNFSNSQTFGMSPNYLVMLIFLCLFITGSFSLLIFNTVCVHLC